MNGRMALKWSSGVRVVCAADNFARHAKRQTRVLKHFRDLHNVYIVHICKPTHNSNAQIMIYIFAQLYSTHAMAPFYVAMLRCVAHAQFDLLQWHGLGCVWKKKSSPKLPSHWCARVLCYVVEVFTFVVVALSLFFASCAVSQYIWTPRWICNRMNIMRACTGVPETNKVRVYSI